MRELWLRFRRAISTRVTVFDRIEATRDRSTIVFASSRECARAVRSFIRESRGRRSLCMALPTEGTGLSPERRKHAWSLANAVLGEEYKNYRDDNILGLWFSLDIDPAFLLGATRLVWFRSTEEPDIYEVATGGWSCAVNTALAIRLGLDVRCFDENGRTVPSPLSGDLADFVNEALERWLTRRRLFTDRIREEGIVLEPGWCEPALWSMDGGGIDVGCLDLSPELTWRIRRLEQAFDSYGEHFPPEVEHALFRSELSTCATGLRNELGAKVIVKGFCS